MYGQAFFLNGVVSSSLTVSGMGAFQDLGLNATAKHLHENIPMNRKWVLSGAETGNFSAEKRVALHV